MKTIYKEDADITEYTPETECSCESCGWSGKVKDLKPDTRGGYVPGDCNEHVFCPNCGTEGWIVLQVEQNTNHK